MERCWHWIDRRSASRKGEAFYTLMEEKSTESTTVVPRLLLGITTLLLAQAITANTTQALPARTPQIASSYGKLPLHFEANQGQTDPQVRFLARGAGYSLLLTATEAVLRLQKPAPREVGTPALAPHKPPLGHAKGAKAPVPRETATLRMQLIGANAHPTVTGQPALPGTVNYFRGQDPTQWRSGVPTYQRVRMQGSIRASI